VVSATAPTPRSLIRLSWPEPLIFHSRKSSIILTRLSGPRSRPTTQESNPGPLDLQPGTLTTRPQRRSTYQNHLQKLLFCIGHSILAFSVCEADGFKRVLENNNNKHFRHLFFQLWALFCYCCSHKLKLVIILNWVITYIVTCEFVSCSYN
jgi:hypothetical protein